MMADPIAVWSSFLASPEASKTAMSPLELDGYLTGIVVTPQAVPILPSTWIARLWGDDEPIFEDEAQINTVLGAVMIHYNTLLRDIDRSLERLEADRMVDYRPLFLSADQKPAHDAVRTWVPRLLEGDGACPRDLECARGGRADQDHHCAICRLLRNRQDRATRNP
jgi:uncharacterized protein